MKNICKILCVGAIAMTSAASVQAAEHEVYAKAGFLGVGAGYAYGLSERFTLRGDFTTMGNYSRSGTSSNFDYEGKIRNNVGTLYGDWFPLNNGFRLTAGLGVRQTKFSADGRPNASGQVTIGDTTINYSGADSAWAKVEYPNVTPYLGIGWGHNVAQDTKGGWGFVADAGVYFGKADVDFNVSPTVYAKLNAASGGNAQQEIEKQRSDIEDKLGKYKVIPVLYVGVSYRF